MDELLPCPFCGGKAVIFDSEENFDVTVYYAECLSCMNGTKYKQTKKEATKVWNTRTPPPEPPQRP